MPPRLLVATRSAGKQREALRKIPTHEIEDRQRRHNAMAPMAHMSRAQ